MNKIISILLILFSLEAKIQNKPDLKKKQSANKEKKLDCSAFLKGNFESYDEKGNLEGKIFRDGKCSYYEDKTTDLKMKSELIYDKNLNCKISIKKIQIESSTLSDEQKTLIKNFIPTEEIYKIDKDKAYFRGINCDCKGYYKKIN